MGQRKACSWAQAWSQQCKGGTPLLHGHPSARHGGCSGRRHGGHEGQSSWTGTPTRQVPVPTWLVPEPGGDDIHGLDDSRHRQPRRHGGRQQSGGWVPLAPAILPALQPGFDAVKHSQLNSGGHGDLGHVQARAPVQPRQACGVGRPVSVHAHAG